MRLAFKKGLLLISAFFLSGLFRFAILFLPFKQIAIIMGTEGVETSSDSKDEHSYKIRVIRWAVVTASLYARWKSLCMVQALTAQLLLRAFSIPSTLYLGVAKKEQDQLIAHAWLRSGAEIVTGGEAMDDFKAIIWYGNAAEGEK